MPSSDDFKISDNSGHSLKYENGQFSGDMEIVDFDCIGDKIDFKITIPYSDIITVSLYGKESRALIGDDTDFYSVASAEPFDAYIHLGKGITIKSENSVYDVGIGSNKTAKMHFFEGKMNNAIEFISTVHG